MTHSANLKPMFDMTQKKRLRFKFLSLLYIVLFCFFSSCSPNENYASSEIGNYKIEIVDSVSFDRLSRLEILDYHPQNQELLINDSQLREILIIDKQGELVSSFNPFVEGPLYVGDESYGWRFYGSDQLVGYGRVYFYLFTVGSEKVERLDYPAETNSWWLLDYDPKMIFTFPNQGQIETLAIIPGVVGPKYKTKAYQDSTRMIYAMNLATRENRSVFAKPAHSVYRTIDKYIDRGWPLIAKGKDHHFAMTYSADSNLYIMDAINDVVTNTIALPKTHQPVYETIPFEAKGRPDLMKINSGMISTGETFIVRSLSIIPESIQRQISETEEGKWWESDAYKEASRKYIKSQALLFNEERYLGPVEWNTGKVGFDNISTSEGFFWLHRVYDDERDYHTFLKAKVIRTD